MFIKSAHLKAKIKQKIVKLRTNSRSITFFPCMHLYAFGMTLPLLFPCLHTYFMDSPLKGIKMTYMFPLLINLLLKTECKNWVNTKICF